MTTIFDTPNTIGLNSVMNGRADITNLNPNDTDWVVRITRADPGMVHRLVLEFEPNSFFTVKRYDGETVNLVYGPPVGIWWPPESPFVFIPGDPPDLENEYIWIESWDQTKALNFKLTYISEAASTMELGFQREGLDPQLPLSRISDRQVMNGAFEYDGDSDSFGFDATEGRSYAFILSVGAFDEDTTRALTIQANDELPFRQIDAASVQFDDGMIVTQFVADETGRHWATPDLIDNLPDRPYLDNIPYTLRMIADDPATDQTNLRLIDGAIIQSLDFRGDADWVAADVLPAQTYRVTLSALGDLTPGNLILSVHDGTTAVQILDGTDTDEDPLSFDFSVLLDGEVFFGVTTEDGMDTGSYRIELQSLGGTIVGTFDADVLNGTPGDDSIIGLSGDDILRGLEGNDTLDGTDGNDTMVGGPGSDTFLVDSAGDRVSESRNWDGIDTVIATVDFRMGRAHIENLILSEDSLVATLGAGNGLANVITGNSGDNILDGGKNNDTLIGGFGNDTYLIRAPGDTAVEEFGEGIDTVRAFRSYALEAHVERLFMQTVYTRDGNPAIFNGIGNGLDNTIVGTPFANTIIGREGRDTLKGQLGADAFVFDRSLGADNVDRIIDFNTNAANEGDTLKMKGSVFGGMAAGALAAADFVAGTAALDASDRFIFDQTSGQLWFDADGSGAAAQQLVATFEQNAQVTAADIEIF